MNSGLDFSSFLLVTHVLYISEYVINLEQLHFGPHLHVILVKFSFSKCSLLRHAA